MKFLSQVVFLPRQKILQLNCLEVCSAAFLSHVSAELNQTQMMKHKTLRRG